MDYIKLMRSIKDKSFYSKDSEKVHLWVHLLLTANWSEREETLGGKPILCNAGQFTTGRKQLAMATGISESKIERLLTYFEKIEQQIEQQKTSTNRLITVLNWDKYQVVEQRNKQRVNNDRTTSEQRVNTLKEEEEIKEEEKIKQSCFSFDDFWNVYPIKTGKSTAKNKYDKLSEIEKHKIKSTINEFISYKPFSTYNHPMPATYINQKRWEDEIQKVELQNSNIIPEIDIFKPNEGVFIDFGKMNRR